ncbi:MAG: hypothetical protein IT493_13965 [Gammaproteobacteria bacterium]|nr:hypothetical protein [Gammaproteobacteria bacterium]
MKIPRRYELPHAERAGIVHFGGRLEQTDEIVVMQMPFLGEACELEPVSFEVLAPQARTGEDHRRMSVAARG